MNARGLGMLLAVASLIATGTYVFVYLYRWEWNRAILTATLFIAAEIALVAMVLTKRLRAIQRELGDGGERSRADHDSTARIVHAAVPQSRVGFAWLARPDRLGVFVPVLLAGGVLLTGVAWLVERLARLTAGPAAERRILTGLERLRLPEAGFLTPPPDRLRLLRGPLTGARW
ncbi:hypothetical protein [Nocardia cyriacigeorgica]|uniref:hypothetical protein n=1 Tax=Nocardia cyriacigeorgica TaxID=135487 RepID=UPI0013D73DF2|nr:hypothetical protein [Nocardia cyriacigeorgica]MBF6435528.1 hypothetical protein [Nocardia cyriacigeorgica]MBF6454393.1 hypothetical protein [Nocardia cyriacigeorgica]MBF6478316.1 hypothetical protein [Nocardia cyriacigeorgica]MBF6552287.1 hypothetical protein [Nocardia cyriacigeorgica]NEW25937.1 hypothetical protein [Nocardia cyriacigeorgica]